jgi:adenylate kinase
MATATSNQVAGSPASHSEVSQSAIAPGPILLLGAPGVGKGTQSDELVRLFGIPHISTGNLLRAHRDAGTELGKMADELMNAGKLVPDSLVNEMVADRLSQPDVARGFILDGFPRTLAQADWLDGWLSSRPGVLPVVAVSIQVDYTHLLQRITGRRTCPVCGTIYNVFLKPSKTPGVCDLEGAALAQRSDDTEICFNGRMHTYESLTAPVIEHYRALSRFAEVNGDQPVADVAASIVSTVERLRA